ncbi:MAG: 30S ribosomal protein S20 [Sedimentisphaerales bacterium]|nr:30S ribosomal protein S20 [Sedimentisphaerales bacterium]
MAHSLSAKKRIRQNAKRRMRNRAHHSAVKTQIKKYVEITKQSKDVSVIEKELKETQKKIDQLAAKGIIHKNKASRKKAQIARQLNAVKAKLQ